MSILYWIGELVGHLRDRETPPDSCPDCGSVLIREAGSTYCLNCGMGMCG